MSRQHRCYLFLVPSQLSDHRYHGIGKPHILHSPEIPGSLNGQRSKKNFQQYFKVDSDALAIEILIFFKAYDE
jgi:hypothetical protein